MTIASTIEDKLTAGLAPAYLQVVNESDNHNVPRGSESHFKVTVASTRFDGMATLHRHRMVYGLLADELAGPVHALALHTYSEEQWDAINAPPCSPLCHGGSKAEVKTAAPTPVEAAGTPTARTGTA